MTTTRPVAESWPAALEDTARQALRLKIGDQLVFGISRLTIVGITPWDESPDLMTSYAVQVDGSAGVMAWPHDFMVAILMMPPVVTQAREPSP